MPALGERLGSDAHQNAACSDAPGRRNSEEVQPAGAALAQEKLPSALLSSVSGRLNSRPLSAEAVTLMEQKLREALDNASFECAVVRVDTGIYNFGAVTAMVELAAETMEVVALRSDGTFEPIDDFIRHIAQESRRSADAREAEPASEDQALSAGEATVHSLVSDANVGSQALGQGSAPPENASGGLSTDAARQEQEPRAAVNHHLTAQVAAPKYVPMNVNPVANVANAAQWPANPMGSLANMAGPGLGVHGAPAPAPAAHSLGTSGRAGSLTEVGGGARPASQVVTPMQLHASSVPPLLGMPKSASSTPERLRMPIVAGIPSAASLMGQIISPRPHSAQKPAVGPQVVSNPHRVLLPTTQTALIMGVTQSPNRQFPVPPGPQPQLHTI
jgi:hypothetical protein